MSNNVPPSPSVLNRLIRLEELEKENARLKSELDRVVTQQQDKSAAKGASLFSEKQSSSSSSGTGSAASSPALKSLKQGVISVVVLGASGDLAVKKTYPALFSLYCHGLLSKNFFIIGYARTAMSSDDYKKKISSKFPTAASKEQKEEFLSHCYYINGQYDNIDDYKRLDTEILKLETSTLIAPASRVFYFAIPPNIFYTVAKGIAEASLSKQGWNRIIVEKPFGHDFDSSAILNRQIGSLFEEDQIYRIDHYLGKEMVQNLMVLRFANKVFEPIWNRNNIQCVLITFKEDFGTQGRGGYFDSFGIIRDVMQNHLFQILSLVAMEPPVTLNAEDVRDEKVKLLRAIKPLDINDLVIGQYGTDPKGKESSYLDDPTVPKDSITPTYALGVFHIHNERWAGTPFILKCGKALNERKAEIRIQFRTPLNNLFHDQLSNNELVLRVQPDEAVYLKLTAKQPGLEGGVRHTELDLSYKTRFAEAKQLPDAYERLIYDVIRGDHNLFVRADELSAAWSIFTPVLHQLEKEKIKPILYEYGSRGPKEADELSFKYGYNRTLGYKWIDQPLSSAALHNSSAGSKL